MKPAAPDIEWVCDCGSIGEHNHPVVALTIGVWSVAVVGLLLTALITS